ncbi:MAG: hypothetical protein IPN69_21520 [Acidobacteria bacterium]|nr:hypothetical protein [Acidobacteriota bacterium]MBK8148431.1 hypothetical protein [Acidobacteriota bacterium]MBK8813286.1 hypothetical protein [Acidobacteriota bacterium]
MVKQNERLLAEFGNPTPNYLVLGIGAFMLVGLLVGLIWSIAAGSGFAAVLFGLSAVGLVALLWLNFAHWRKLSAGERNRNLHWEIDLPESQRLKLSREVVELARILEIPREQLSDLLSAYIVAQDLALRQIQQEARMPVLRHVVVGNTPFDGVIVKGDLITCVEVTFLVTPIVSQEKINIVLKKVAAPMKSLKNLKIDARVRLLLVLVTQLDDAAEAQLRSSLVKKFGSTPVDVDIRLLDFEALQKIYAMD